MHNHPGNLHYRQVLRRELEAYNDNSASRSSKGAIIRKVIQEIRSESHGGYGFVKRDPKTSRWLVLEDISARTSVGQAFRDLIHDKSRTPNRKTIVPKQSKPKPDCDAKAEPNFQSLQDLLSSPATSPCNETVSLPQLPTRPAFFSRHGSSDDESVLLDKLLQLVPEPATRSEDPFEPVPIREALPTPTRSEEQPPKTNISFPPLLPSSNSNTFFGILG